MLGELRGALREQHAQAFGPVHERDEHRGRYRIGGKVPLQPDAALRIDAEQAPVGEIVPGLRAVESPQDPAAQVKVTQPSFTQPWPPPFCNPPRVSAAGSSSRRNSSSFRPDISSATSNTGRPSE